MKKWIYRIVLLICIGVFLYSAGNLYIIFNKKTQSDVIVQEIKKEVIKEDEEEGFLVDWQALKGKNADIVAWLYVPDCSISYPVVQTTDNATYLDYNVNGEYDEMGSIFMDFENASDFSDFNTLIYGHSVMGTGGMFTDLNKYEDKAFFDGHKEIYIFTPNGNYKGNVVCYAQTTDRSIFYYQNCENHEEHINELKYNSLYANDVEIKGNLVTLSTCDLDYGLHGEQRLVLVATLEPWDEPIIVK